MERVSAVVEVLRKVSGHVVNRVPAMRSSDAVDAILDAITQEAEYETKRMEEDLEEAKLGARGFENRIARTDEVESKVSRYEELLGRKLDTIRERLEALRANLTVAMMKADTNGGEGSSLASL
jgi:predicted  nucleic acid-binding Zn-ribbon protein